MDKKDGALEPRDKRDMGEKTRFDDMIDQIKKSRASDSDYPFDDDSESTSPAVNNNTIPTSEMIPLTDGNQDVSISRKSVTGKIGDETIEQATQSDSNELTDEGDTRPKTVKPKTKSNRPADSTPQEEIDPSGTDDRSGSLSLNPDEPIIDSRDRYTQLTDESDRKRPDMGRDTAILSASNNRLRRVLSNRAPDGTTSLGDQREIIFVIRGMVERVILTDNLSVFLGRSEPGSRSQVDIDMTPYGALDRGVSRVHARLHLENNKIFVTDLGSTNGTFLAGKRLEPNNPEPLRKGDELLLGRLAVQVLFR